MYLRLIPIHMYILLRIVQTYLITVDVRLLFDVRNHRNEIILLKLYYYYYCRTNDNLSRTSCLSFNFTLVGVMVTLIVI